MTTGKEAEDVKKLLYWVVGLMAGFFMIVGGGAFTVINNANAQQWRDIQEKLDKKEFIRFEDKVDEKFDKVDKKFDKFSDKFDKFDEKFDKQVDEIKALIKK